MKSDPLTLGSASLPSADLPADTLSAILNSLEAIVYVSDMETYELLFVNRHTLETLGPLKPGQRCWEYLQEGQSSPCAFCTNDKLVDDEGEPTGPYNWEFRNTRNGHWYQIVDRAVPWKDGRLVRVEIAIDVTERKQHERLVMYQARHDLLTGLPNRAALLDALTKIHAGAERYDLPFSLLLMDLDHFKRVNDTFGHEAGDDALRGVARIVSDSLRESDWLGRWGGEEFLALLPETEVGKALQIAERVRLRLAKQTLRVGGHQLGITTSIGVVSYPKDAAKLEGLLSAVDAKLYAAKRGGRNRVVGGATDEIYSIPAQLESALQADR